MGFAAIWTYRGLVCQPAKLGGSLWLISVTNPSRSGCRKQCRTSVVVSYYTPSNKPLCFSSVFQITCSVGLNAGWKHLALGWPTSLRCNPSRWSWLSRMKPQAAMSAPAIPNWLISSFPNFLWHLSAARFSPLCIGERMIFDLGCSYQQYWD